MSRPKRACTTTTTINYTEIDGDKSDGDKRLPHLANPAMTDEQRRNISPDEEEIRSIYFPEKHDDGKWWSLVVKISDDGLEEEVYVELAEACHKFRGVGGGNNGNVSYVEWMNDMRVSEMMTCELWSVIEVATLVPVQQKIEVGTLCYVIRSKEDLKYRYVIVTGVDQKKCLVGHEDEWPIYHVHNIEVDDTAAGAASYRVKKLKATKTLKPTGVLPINMLKPVVHRNIPNAMALVYAHYYRHEKKLERRRGQIDALKLEFQQILYCFGSKIYGSMNNKTYRSSGTITHRERISGNVFDNVARTVFERISGKMIKVNRGTHFDGLDYKQLAALIGLDYLSKKVGTDEVYKKYYITSISGRYDPANMQFTMQYWLAYDDETGTVHTKAQAK